MDTTSLGTIIISIILLGLFIKFVISPLIRAVLGIIIFLLIIYALQKITHFNTNSIFGSLSPYMDISKWSFINWILWPVDYLINKFALIFNSK